MPCELIVTYLQASRGLLWTEFIPLHRADDELSRAENAGQTERADAIRSALEKVQSGLQNPDQPL